MFEQIFNKFSGMNCWLRYDTGSFYSVLTLFYDKKYVPTVLFYGNNKTCYYLLHIKVDDLKQYFKII